MRIGGLDVVFSSLANQTFKDFELVFADNIYEYRKDIVKEKAKEYGIRYKHVPPIVNRFPLHALCHTTNSAIAHADGDVILLTLDYRYFMPDCLQKHAEFHKSHADNFGYAPASKFVIPGEAKIGLPAYGYNEGFDQYLKDLNDGKLQDYMWSILDKEFDTTPQDPSSWEELDRTKVGHDPKLYMPPGTEVSPMLIFLHSESMKSKIVFEANGLNEDLDGAHSHTDIEFSHRLRNLFDYKWIADNTNISYRITGGHNVVHKLRLDEKKDSGATAVFDKYKNGSKDRVNTWSLSKQHEINQATEQRSEV